MGTVSAIRLGCGKLCKSLMPLLSCGIWLSRSHSAKSFNHERSVVVAPFQQGIGLFSPGISRQSSLWVSSMTSRQGRFAQHVHCRMNYSLRMSRKARPMAEAKVAAFIWVPESTFVEGKGFALGQGVFKLKGKFWVFAPKGTFWVFAPKGTFWAFMLVPKVKFWAFMP